MPRRSTPQSDSTLHSHDHAHDRSPGHAHDRDHKPDHGHEHGHAEASPAAPKRTASKKPGIYLVSPSGALPDPEVIDRASTRLSELGFRVTADRDAALRDHRFAGTDDQRLAALNRAAAHSAHIVMATRGGYGLSRLLDRIDWRAMADSGKRFVGHSDFTFFQLALLAKTGAVSWAGPMASFDFGGKKTDDLTEALFLETMSGELEILSFESEDADPVDCRGILWGGNLTVVASLVGTPYLPRERGILFLEDVNEHPYRIERMLIQLAQAGILAKQKAIVLGGFTDYKLGPHDAGYDMNAVIQWLRKTVKVPVITGLPFGHVKTKATLPVGAKIGIAVEDGMAHLVFQEHGHEH